MYSLARKPHNQLNLAVLLGCPKSSFGFIHHILWKYPKELFGQPNITKGRIKEWIQLNHKPPLPQDRLGRTMTEVHQEHLQRGNLSFCLYLGIQPHKQSLLIFHLQRCLAIVLLSCPASHKHLPRARHSMRCQKFKDGTTWTLPSREKHNYDTHGQH